MPKVPATDLANLQDETTAVAAINTNFDATEAAFDEVLFRTGTGAATDNAMEADLDMNNNRILNLPEPVDDLEPARLVDISTNLTATLAAQTAAEAAQTAAEAAQTAAETAETNAETAETNAEAAQAAAEAAAIKYILIIAVSDETTPITTGTGKVAVRLPAAMTLSEIRGSLTTASSSGVVQVDVNENGTTVFATELTIDASEKTSETAATPSVLSDTALAEDSEITVDIVSAGTNAAGLKVTLIGTFA